VANTILTIDMITREALRLWKNTNAFMQHVSSQYDDQYAKTGAKIGATLRVRLPNDYVTRTGPAVNVQNTAEQNTTLALATQAGVDVSFSTQERTMQLDDYSRRVLAPMVNNLAGAVAADIMSGAEGGISGFTANLDSGGNIISPTSETYLRAGAVLTNMSAPLNDRRAITDPKTMAVSVSSFSGLFNPQAEISEQYRSGMLRTAWGMEFYQDQTVLKHTGGTFSAGGTVNGANQTGLSVTVNAITGTLNQGDIVTFDGVNAVNRITKQSTQVLAQFVVTGPVATAATSIPIYPAIIPPDPLGNKVQYQTTDNSPANNAQMRLVNPANASYIKNFLFVPDAVTIAMADLEMPHGVHEAARETFDGVSMRMVTDYVIGTDQLITRLDVLYGYKWLRPEWACIIADSTT
jgi:hypothetical protein